MPIFEFVVSQTILVDVSDEVYAENAARDAVTELDWQNYDVEYIRPITSMEELSGMDWDGNCIPYGGDGNTRLKDILPG